jgi:hypothetical protein
MKRVKLLAAGMLVLGQALSGAASAAPVTLFGSTVDFTFDDGLLGLFGTPGVSGDTLFFTPTKFDAQAFNGSAFGLTKETVHIKVATHNGYEFSSANLLERGDYLLLGPSSAVNVGGQIRVFDLAAPSTDLTAPIASQVAMTTVGLPTHNWTASASADVSMLDASAINVTLENILIASAFSPDSLAFVEKKYAGLTIGTLAVTPVPEADTYAMMLAGLGLVGWMARRRAA